MDLHGKKPIIEQEIPTTHVDTNWHKYQANGNALQRVGMVEKIFNDISKGKMHFRGYS